MIEGAVIKPGGGGSGRPPPFRVTVPSVDVDWEGFTDWNHEGGEDARFVIAPFTNAVPAIRWLRVNIPYDDYTLVHPVLTLHWAGANDLRLLREDGTLFANGGQIDSRAVPSWPLRFRVEPLSPTPEFVVRLLGEADNVTGEKAVDTIHGRIVNADLDVDANYDDVINGADEPLEETPGGLACVRTNNLTPITLTLAPKPGLPGKLTLSATMGGQRIKVWENANRTGDIVLPKTWNAGATIPGTLYVEGITNSATARDVELRLEYDENPQGQNNPLFKCADAVRLTILSLEFDNVWDRNLDPLDNGNFPDYEKCIAIEHENAMHKVNLLDYLKIQPTGLSFDDIKGFVSFHIAHQIFDAASVENDSDLVYDDDDPGDTDIYAFGIELRWDATVLDRLIVVIYDEDTDTEYTTWTTNNAAPPGWLGELPAVHGSLGPDNSDPEPGAPGQWGGVNGLNNNYHYSAAFEMRSVETAGGHGHQTCYDGDGNLIEDDGAGDQSRASCGTADAQHWSDVLWPPTHFTDDVQPFIRAAQLDGNPVDGVGALNNPLIRWGPNLQAYLNRRPPHTANQVP